MSENLTVIGSDKLRAQVDPKGACLRTIEFLHQGQWTHMGDPTADHKIPALFIAGPLVNRTRDSKMMVDGEPFDLKHPNEHALHGTFPLATWHVQELVTQMEPAEDKPDNAMYLKMKQSEDAPALPWPSDFEALVKFIIHGATLEVDIRITNVGDKPMYGGAVTHGAWNPRRGPKGELPKVQFEAEEWFDMIDGLPTGTISPVAKSRLDFSKSKPIPQGLDDCCRGWDMQKGASLTWEEFGLRIKCRAQDPYSTFLQAWLGVACALEPQTSVADAANLKHSTGDENLGVIVIEPKSIMEVRHMYDFEEL